MLPTTFEAWVFILVTCSISFLIGQWLRKRRNKIKTHDDYINGLKRSVLAETRAQTKKVKKKKAHKKNGSSKKE
jgi:hypothetical protein